MSNVPPDPWFALRAHTAARIALGRSGSSLPTAEWLRFGVAHARARDAVHAPFDCAALAAQLGAHGFATIEVESAAADRAVYLRRPDLGRRLSARSVALLAARGAAADTPGAADGAPMAKRPGLGSDVLCVVGDGLSATAVHLYAVDLLRQLLPLFEATGLALGPVVLARQARVALGDEVGAALHARLVVMLVGERPGLSAADSLGAYLTWAPRPGRRDAERNCVSNIRPAGLPLVDAARRIAWLIGAARRLGATGIALKDGSDAAWLPGNAGAAPTGPSGLPAPSLVNANDSH